MNLKTFINHCTPEARDFLKYIHKRKGAYVTEQVIAEIVQTVGLRATKDLLTKPGMFRQVLSDIRVAVAKGCSP